MTEKNTQTSTKKFLGFIILIFVISLVLGLFSINYISGIAIIGGILISFPVVGLLKYIVKHFPKITPTTGIILLLVISQVIFFVFFTLNAYHPYVPTCDISDYRITAIPESSQLTSITIQEYVVPKDVKKFNPPSSWITSSIDNQEGFSLPERKATIQNRGFLLKEVIIEPSISCSDDVFIELNDFPRNSFYAAHYAKDLQKYPYVDTETVTWNPESRVVKFSYIIPPFQVVSPLLTPLVGASNINQWIVGLIGIIGALIFTPIIKTVFTESAQKYLKDKLSDSEITPKQTAKLIISEKGDEKEVEIKKKR